jgi:hypothetical protein
VTVTVERRDGESSESSESSSSAPAIETCGWLWSWLWSWSWSCLGTAESRDELHDLRWICFRVEARRPAKGTGTAMPRETVARARKAVEGAVASCGGESSICEDPCRAGRRIERPGAISLTKSRSGLRL